MCQNGGRTVPSSAREALLGIQGPTVFLWQTESCQAQPGGGQGEKPHPPLEGLRPSSQLLCLPYRDPTGFVDWTFSTVRCWGEEAQGTYRLTIRDVGEFLPLHVSSGEAGLSPPRFMTRVFFRRRDAESRQAGPVAADPLWLIVDPCSDPGAAEVRGADGRKALQQAGLWEGPLP